MATITTINMIDDIDGTTGEDVTTVRFSFDGTDYEIDLSEYNRNGLGKILQPYIDTARKTTTPTATRKTAKKTTGTDPASVRAWATANGITINTRGRIPAHVIEQYHTATGA